MRVCSMNLEAVFGESVMVLPAACSLHVVLVYI
jgi:hypothetical protein